MQELGVIGSLEASEEAGLLIPQYHCVAFRKVSGGEEHSRWCKHLQEGMKEGPSTEMKHG